VFLTKHYGFWILFVKKALQKIKKLFSNPSEEALQAWVCQ
jgi:hypothetical protein